MDSASQKNQAFVTDSVLMLSLIDDIEMLGTTIESLVSQYESGLVTDTNVIFSTFQDIYDKKMKLDDIVSSINMYGWKIFYEESDLEEFNLATQKHCVISNCSIEKNFHMSDYVSDFTFTITNLGLNAIDSGDEVIVKLYNASINQSKLLTFSIENVVSNIMESNTVTVSGLECPTIPYEYTLSIEVRNKESGYIFGSLTIENINILSLSSQEVI